MLIAVSLLVALIGLLIYVLAGNPPGSNQTVVEIGRLMFFAGLLAFLLNAEKIIGLLPH